MQRLSAGVKSIVSADAFGGLAGNPADLAIRLPGVEGQGISWDLSGPKPTLWAIKRSTKQVLQFDVPYRDIDEPPADDWHINGLGHFEP